MTTGSTASLRDTLPPHPLGMDPALRQNAPDLLEPPAGAGPPTARRRPVRVGPLAVYGLLLLGALLMLVPFAFMLSDSLRSAGGVEQGMAHPLPNALHWSNYPRALARMHFFNALANTIFITSLSVAGQILSSSLVGFGFARFRFPGRNIIFMIMLSTMMLPPQVTMIPVFLLFRDLGWINTFLPLIVPAWLASPFFVFMFRQFFAQVPEELIEAARIDGASNWKIYWKFMLPLSLPVIAIVAIYTFLGAWNDYLNPLIYLNSPHNRTLALALSAFSGQYGVRHAELLMAASCVTMLPCVILFFVAQRYFVESVATSGLKG